MQKAVVSELSIIPGWARVLAALAFFGSLVSWGRFVRLLPTDQPEGRAMSAFFLAVGLFMGTMLAAYALLTGYVNRDARRRSMRAGLWTLLVIVIPNAIGFLVYFLVRKPLAIPCPECGENAPAEASYCPKCRFKLGPTCPRCDRAVAPSQAYCPHCGSVLSEASA